MSEIATRQTSILNLSVKTLLALFVLIILLVGLGGWRLAKEKLKT